jgi:hypothetical protein
MMPSLVGPTKTPHQFGFKLGDSHLVVNDQTETLTAFGFNGTKLFTVPCLARGQGGDPLLAKGTVFVSVYQEG